MIITATEYEDNLADFLSAGLPDDAEVAVADDCATLLEHSGPGDTVVISEGFEPDKERLVNVIHALRLNDVRVVVITPSMDGLAESVLNMGVWDIIPHVRDGSEILDVLEHPRTYAQALKLVPQNKKTLGPVLREPVRLVQAEPLVCAFTRAGGAGKSTAIAYLATALLKYGLKPAIVDLDEDKPSVAKIFGINSKEGIDSLRIQELRGDLSLIRDTLSRVRIPLKNGITVYPANGDTLPFEEEGDVYSMYAALQQEHPVVLADLTVRFNDLATLATIRRANKVLFITEQYQPTLDSCVRHVEEARSVGVDTGKYILVVNKYTEKSRITVRKIEDCLGMKAAVILPMNAEKYRNEVDSHNPVSGTDEWLKLGALIANTDYQPGSRKKKGFSLRLFGRRKK
ncbi:MAG: hypothetical protein M0Z41_05225 [Peptococcaceae bacterium]|nr:hypothetical protein [Peptococcaceae bacterium]